MVTGHVSIYNNPVLPSLGSAFHDLVTMKRMLHCLRQCRVGHAGMDTASGNLVTVTGHFDNDELATLDTAFGSLVTAQGCLSI